LNCSAFCLQSVAERTFDKLEVIVAELCSCAGSIQPPDGWPWMNPERFLAMQDNFELGAPRLRASSWPS